MYITDLYEKVESIPYASIMLPVTSSFNPFVSCPELKDQVSSFDHLSIQLTFSFSSQKPKFAIKKGYALYKGR